MGTGGRVGAGLLVGALVVVVAGGGFLVHDGYRVYVVHTSSMVPAYDPGDLVIDRPVTGALQPGEVITFLHSGLSSDVVTHRITDVEDGVIHTKGDANRTADVWDIRPDQVQGVVIGSVPGAGYLLVYLRSPAGIASILTAILGLGLLYSLFFPPREPGAGLLVRPRHAVPVGGRHRVAVPEVEQPVGSGPRHARARSTPD